MPVLTSEPRTASAEDSVRNFMRQYQSDEQISGCEYARRLHCPQSFISDFLGGRRPLGLRVGRKIVAFHPQLRPLLQAWATDDHGDESLSRDGAA